MALLTNEHLNIMADAILELQTRMSALEAAVKHFHTITIKEVIEMDDPKDPPEPEDTPENEHEDTDSYPEENMPDEPD